MVLNSARLLCLLCALGLLLAMGCSISNSSESISKSISSPFKWSSASSDSSSDDDGAAPDQPEPPQQTEAYGADIRQVSATYARSGGEVDALRSQLSSIAAARGITNWDADHVTCRNIGEGIRLGGMDADQLETFAGQVCGDSSAMRASLSYGYNRAQ